jgi:hypothetical protein
MKLAEQYLKMCESDKYVWQMTKAEYEKENGKPKKNTTVTGGYHPHKNAVETALNQGKKVPLNVLADYPELKESLSTVNEDLPVKLQAALDRLERKPAAKQAPMAMKLLMTLIEEVSQTAQGVRLLKAFAPEAYEVVIRGGGEEDVMVNDD